MPGKINPRADVVIVNWNSGNQLSRCIESILQSQSGREGKIFIVDNASKDYSVGALNETDQISPIFQDENVGFAAACNIGASRGNGDYILFLNPDSLIGPRSVSSAIEFMERPENRNAAICGIQLLDTANNVARSSSRFPSAWRLFSRSIGADKMAPKSGTKMLEWAHDETRCVDQVIGAFFLIRRSVFEHLGGFDERFFVYFEEVDLSLRAHQAGWHTIYFAGAQAFHAGGGTSRQIKARRLFYSLRSRVLYAFKHFSFGGAVAVLLATLFIEPISRSVFALVRCSLASLKETWVAYWLLWCWLPRWVLRGTTR